MGCGCMKNKINNTIKKSLNFLKEITKTGLKLTGKVFKELLIFIVAVGIAAIGLSILKGIEIGKKVYQQMKERKQEKKKLKKQNGIKEQENRFIETFDLSVNKEVTVENKEDIILDKKDVIVDSLIPYSYDQIGVIVSNHPDMSYQMRFVIHELEQIRKNIDDTVDSNELKKLKTKLTLKSFELYDLLNSNNFEKTEKQDLALSKVA